MERNVFAGIIAGCFTRDGISKFQQGVKCNYSKEGYDFVFRKHSGVKFLMIFHYKFLFIDIKFQRGWTFL
jgi:hypothetical protein